MKKVLLPFACALCAVAMNAQDATLISTTPVTITSGFNVDCIAENPMTESSDKATYPHMDGHHSMLLVNGSSTLMFGTVSGGIPADGAIETTSGYKYQLANFSGNNDLYLAKKGESGTLVFDAPVEATHIALLMCATDGPEGCNPHPSYSAVLNYEDGTSETVNDRVVADWGCGHARAYRMSQRFRADGQPVENCNLAMAEDVLPVKAGAKVKSVTVTCETEPAMASWGELCYGRFNFLAASALVMQTSGIDAIAVENAEVVAIYNIAGVKVNDFVKGVNVVKYSDGKVRKIFVNK